MSLDYVQNLGAVLSMPTHLSDDGAAPDAATDPDHGSFSNLCPASFYDRSDFDGHIITKGRTATALVAVCGANVGAFMDDAAAADQDATTGRLELGTRMKNAFGLNGDGVRAGQAAIIGYFGRRRSVDGCLWARIRGGRENGTTSAAAGSHGGHRAKPERRSRPA
jgi:hypothetical protein